MPGALRRCLTSAAAAAAVSVGALPCPLASLSLVVCLPPPFFSSPPKDATTRTLNPLVHCRSPLRHFRLRPVTWPALFPPKGRLPRRLGLISTTKPRNASAN